MTISGLDPNGELGRLFSALQPRAVSHSEQRSSNQVLSGGPRDDVALSDLAKEVRAVTARAERVPDVRVDRVQASREAVESQQVLATSGQIADALSRETILNALALS
ncbi:MAG: flagellar biosynthesis anti-sigma factor FlgM [Nitrospirales bacterium]|nr:flagellar biosynthesis anti-sigma factor FlgM [Nitrospira sp.]MDR4502335.1 flagellar biosynthesis anti-sigma factor FlgM [Nitrospirales bacterium]